MGLPFDFFHLMTLSIRKFIKVFLTPQPLDNKWDSQDNYKLFYRSSVVNKHCRNVLYYHLYDRLILSLKASF